MILASCTIGITGCTDEQVIPAGTDEISLQLTRSGDDALETSGASNAVDVYIFKDETLVKTFHVEDPSSEPLSVKNVGNGYIFVTAGRPLDVTVNQTTVEQITAMTAEIGTDGAPMFYSGAATLGEHVYSTRVLGVELERSVARIDVVNQFDQQIQVNEVIVENAPTKSYVFDMGESIECPSVRLSHTFAEPLSGKAEGVFTIFESSQPVNVRIRGLYGNTPMDMTATLPTVQRNKVYTLQVVNAGSKVETTFAVKEWGEGNTVGAGAATGSRLLMDAANSVFPEGVTVDYDNNVVTVPYTGAEGIKIAFLNDTRILNTSTEGLVPTVAITENEIETAQNGYISSFNVDVQPQGKGRLGYSLTMHMSNALLSQCYDFVEIKVEPSPYQIETVFIGGHEWMCFNATSQDLEEQIYILDGLNSVEDMYNQRFAESVGNYFQYGRPNGYSPWTSNSPTAVTRPSDSSPWTKPEYVPLPEGYHIASFTEWEDLVPHNATIPAEYTCRAGERIRAYVVTLPGTLVTPSAAVNSRNFLMRYVVFESLDTGNKLFVPICSHKSNSTAEVPGYNNKTFQDRVSYWVSSDRYVWLIDWMSVNGGDGALLQENRWNYDGFCPVRGIKNPE